MRWMTWRAICACPYPKRPYAGYSNGALHSPSPHTVFTHAQGQRHNWSGMLTHGLMIELMIIQ